MDRDRDCFPRFRVDGLGNDEASVAIGRQDAASHGVADRVDLEVADLAAESADWPPRRVGPDPELVP